jgi:hypothetical protein
MFYSSSFLGTISNEAELMQYLKPVVAGPSLKTCPRWDPQREQLTSVRIRPCERSSASRTESLEMGWSKLGHPVPESNLRSESKRGCPQPTHR